MSRAVDAHLVLDAGVIIAIFDKDDAHATWAHALYRAHAAAQLSANVLTISESMVHAARGGRASDAFEAIGRLGITPVALSEEDVVSLAELRAVTLLRMPDALVLHTALREGAAIATTDARLARVARERGVRAHAPQDGADG